MAWLPASRYEDRRGVILHGHCAEASPDDPRLPDVRRQLGLAFSGEENHSYERKSHGWFVIDVDREVSWDFSRIPPSSDRMAGGAE
jgi:hypothetical protein